MAEPTTTKRKKPITHGPSPVPVGFSTGFTSPRLWIFSANFWLRTRADDFRGGIIQEIKRKRENK